MKCLWYTYKALCEDTDSYLIYLTWVTTPLRGSLEKANKSTNVKILNTIPQIYSS